MSEIARGALQAYADGQLDPAARAALEAAIARDPDTAAELAALRRQADAIRAHYGSAGAEPVPARLDPRRLAERAGRHRWQALARAAMILVALGVGLAAGLLLRPAGPAPYDRLIADAVSAHTVYAAESRHAVEVAGAESAHLSSWLSNRLAAPLAMPDLGVQGFAFLGGRLLPAPETPGGRAAQLMYEDAAGERLSLYITPANGIAGPAYEAVRLGTDTALYWADGVFTCTIVGPQPAARLEGVARAVFAQLGAGGVPYRDL